jgi:hypothetical protein
MITNAERDHLKVLKHWAQETRRVFEEAKTGPFAKLLERLSSVETVTRLLDNVDWLVAVLERESLIQAKKNLSRLGK